MEINTDMLRNLISRRRDEIEKSVDGTGYLPKTVVGVATFLVDNEADVDLLSSRQRVVFDKFILPLLCTPE